MVTIVMLALIVTAQNSAGRHVRASEPRILALIDAGLSRSTTFRRLVEMLDASDVIVYIDPKRLRQTLGGYLSHNITTAGGYRYLHVVIETGGTVARGVALLAHELQHAVEVAQAPDARDPQSLERLFRRLAVKYGCDNNGCFETNAANDVEETVRKELIAASRAAVK